MNLRQALASQPMRPFQIRVVALCILLAFVDGFEVLVGAFVAPTLAKADVGLGLDNVQTGYFLSASTFGMALGAIIVAPFADRIGRRRHILLCLLLIAVGMGGSAMAPGFGFLLVARAFAGLWIGALIPSLNILVSEYSSDAKRGVAMGIYGIGLPAGSAAGGAMTSVVVSQWGWRGPFWAGFIATVVLFFVAIAWVPESIHYLVEKRPAGALQAYNKIAAKLGYPTEDRLPEAHVGNSSGVVVTALFRGIMAKRTALLWLGYMCLSSAFYFANAWTPKLLADAKLLPTAAENAAAGVRTGVFVSIGGIIGGLLFAWLASRMHPRLITAGLLCFGLVAFVLYANLYTNLTLALVLAMLVGLSTNGAIVAYYAISPSVYPTAARGTGVGWMIGVGRGAAILAPIIAGYLLAAGMSSPMLYQIFGLILLASGILVFMLHRTYQGGDEDADQVVARASQAATR